MRILVTNDDGIDSTGLHVLARSLVPFGEVERPILNIQVLLRVSERCI